MKKINIVSVLRVLSQISTVLLFVALLYFEKLQLWIILFGVTALLSVLFGRFYCSWICPMNSSFNVIRIIFAKFKIKRFKTPKFLTRTIFRVILFIFFILSMALSMFISKKMKIRIDILLYITLFSIIITLFFEEKLWHRHICPFGAILSVTSRFSLLKMKINEESCISCGKCQKVCPTGAIETLEDKKRRVTKQECLLCGQCQKTCPVDVCNFTMKQ